MKKDEKIGSEIARVRTPAPLTISRSAQTTEPSAGREPAARAKQQYMNVCNILNRQMIWSAGSDHGGTGSSTWNRQMIARGV
eukprot:COSAG03_NODE_74_length_14441_cov_13.158974_8_plen_82_part_00